MLWAIILASGYSRRMGQDKLLMPLGNSTILEHTLQTVTSSHLRDIIMVCKDRQYEHLINKYNLRYIINKNNNGIASSICYALDAVNENPRDGYMFLLADMPLIKVSTLNILIEAFKLNPAKIIIPTYEGKWGNPRIFPGVLRVDLQKLTGDVGARSILNKYKEIIVEIKTQDENILIDIDTMIQYKSLEEGEGKDDRYI